MAPQALSALLDRFRRGAAVPAAVSDDLAAELAPVFASLELLEAEAREVREISLREAEDRLAAGRERVAEISAGWRERAEAERARAAEERQRLVHEQGSAIEAEGRAEAARIRTEGSARIPELVDEVIACLERGPP